MREGEKNTRFFHKAMVQHRQHNRIFSLKNEVKDIIVCHEDMEELVVHHFHTLLSEPEQDRSEAIHRITQKISHLITRYLNLSLIWVVTLEEVVKAMAKNKAQA